MARRGKRKARAGFSYPRAVGRTRGGATIVSRISDAGGLHRAQFQRRGAPRRTSQRLCQGAGNRRQKKAIIFTESTRTQQYLLQILEASPYKGKIVLFNGNNNDPRSREIYKAWIQRHQGTDRVTGSPTADMRAALVDYFREEATIMVATEAAAEGINLQFCSLVVNYDLP